MLVFKEDIFDRMQRHDEVLDPYHKVWSKIYIYIAIVIYIYRVNYSYIYIYIFGNVVPWWFASGGVPPNFLPWTWLSGIMGYPMICMILIDHDFTTLKNTKTYWLIEQFTMAMGLFLGRFDCYPLVNVYIAIENHHFSWENPL